MKPNIKKPTNNNKKKDPNNGQKTYIDISPKKTYRGQTGP